MVEAGADGEGKDDCIAWAYSDGAREDGELASSARDSCGISFEDECDA